MPCLDLIPKTLMRGKDWVNTRKLREADKLTTPNLSRFRIRVLREAMSTLPPNAEVQAIFDAALEDMRKAGAQVVDPVVGGIDIGHWSESYRSASGLAN